MIFSLKIHLKFRNEIRCLLPLITSMVSNSHQWRNYQLSGAALLTKIKSDQVFKQLERYLCKASRWCPHAIPSCFREGWPWVQNLVRRETLRKKCPYSELFWSVFSGIVTEKEKIQSISPYSVGMWENADQNNSEYGHFSSSEEDNEDKMIRWNGNEWNFDFEDQFDIFKRWQY